MITEPLDSPSADASVLDGETQVRSNFADPVFILAPPCTFSWALCAMLGQHPQMYALPELHLFSAETMAEWWNLCSRESYEMDHGLARTVADLYFGEQTDDTIVRARGWLRRRAHFTTGFLLEVLAQRLSPLIPIEKSPSIVSRREFLQRAFAMFPNARFLHLVSHPRGFGEWVMDRLRELDKAKPLAESHWLRHLASYPYPGSAVGSGLDPQKGWYVLHSGILDFLSSVPADQQRTLKGEDLVGDTSAAVLQIMTWLGVRADSEALDSMKHPELSPYAHYGPANARFGSDIFLVPGPVLHPAWLRPQKLEGPLSWREDGGAFLPEVKALAQRFGYE